MRKYDFGFIGCGNMGGILLEAVAKSEMGSICACDSDKTKVKYMTDNFGADEVDILTAAENSRYLFLGVKPQSFKGVFDTIRDIIKKRDDIILVSMAAGIEISTLEELAEKKTAVIRIMPNTSAKIGEGVILVCRNNSVNDQELETFKKALSPAGFIDDIEEGKIDAAAALSGCGPAFADIFIEALADGAVSCGLARDKAVEYAARTVSGAAKTVYLSGKSPAELKDAVCSPGGTTIAGVRAAEKCGLRTAAFEAVVAAFEKTKELK